jgi:GNAT superfamily N-acetyltransferase
MSNLNITYEPDASQADREFIREAIAQYNIGRTGDAHYTPVNLFLRDSGGTIQGGLLAGIWGGWLDIAFLWVAESLRHHGYGSQLLQMAEDMARERRCRGAFLTTFSFQARPFYERFGYAVQAELPDYPPGHRFYFMRKLFDQVA